jgi:hypothetical protein
MRSRASLFGLLAVAVALGAALSTRAVAMCMDGDCGSCNPCNAASWCYDPCSDPGLWCYAAAGCGGPVCSECDPSSSCYDPCTLSCFDETTCGWGPTDPSPMVCDLLTDGVPEQGAMDLGFASVVEESGPAEVVTGAFTLCVDFPPTGEVRRVFGADNDNSAETSQGVASAALRIYGLSSETMTGPSLSANDRRDITNCVQSEVNKAMQGSPNRIAVTTACPTAASQQPFGRVIVGNPSAGLAAQLRAHNDADGVAAVRGDCKPRDNGVGLVSTAKNRNNRHLCESIVHEFFHGLGLVHVEDRGADFAQDIMQEPRVAGQRYTSTNTDIRTKDEQPKCAERQNTNKKVQQAIAVVVQPICPGHGCERDKGENCATCAPDCGQCGADGPFCGDGICNGDETCDTCPDCPPCGGGGPPGGGGVCCESIPGSNCLFIPCGAGWRCINNSCFPGCVSDQDCAFLCSGPDGGLCQCQNGQCVRTSSCVCDCTGPFCCPPCDPHCTDSGGGGPGGGGDPVWDWCFFDVCRGDFDCAGSCWEFFAQ